MIRHLRHADIDKRVWDERLRACSNALWYGLSGTLDAAAPGWDALVDDERGALLALPWRRKFGITYAYQPFLLQQLGVFAPDPGKVDATDLLNALPKHIRYADIYLGTTKAPSAAPQVQWSEQTDLVLPLAEPIEQLRKAYSENHKRNLRKGSDRSMAFDPVVPVEELITFLAGSEQFKRWGIDPMRVATMERLFRWAMQEGTGRACGMRNPAGTLVAGAFLVEWGGRILFLKGLADAEGRGSRALHALLDRTIEQYAEHDQLFDFAGTNDAELARFYQGFGARRVVYLRALVNRLPPLIRRMKP